MVSERRPFYLPGGVLAMSGDGEQREVLCTLLVEH